MNAEDVNNGHRDMQEYFPCMSLSLTINPQSSLLTISLPFIYPKAYPPSTANLSLSF